ncbi:MAG TPA: carbohydrate-binding module family 20 domain-containing protein [Myxococcaceae bacterium]|nr:carbohydrate-binding module family 20 domain-containing protein [Myxococcaceae bacterium]
MNHKAMKLAAALAASTAALLLGCEPPSNTVSVDFTVDVSGVIRPQGSGVSIVGNAFSLGATADKPDGDPVHGLKLRQQPDGTWRASAWLPKLQPKDPAHPLPEELVTYAVYMSNPYAPEIASAGGSPVSHTVDFTRATGESITVAAFDVPQNIVKPCVDFTVTVPANTPSGDPVYMGGDDDQLGQWNPSKFFTMTSDGAYTYSSHLCFDVGKELHYKYVRSFGDWSKVEKNADGSERPDRALTITEDVSHGDTVVKWADL